MKKRNLFLFFLLAVVSLPAVPLSAQTDPLLNGFQNPPRAARPHVWWHWMNGNVTKDGINKDLHWMKRVGIGGVHIFDAKLSTPVIVKKRVTFMSDDWKDCYRFAVDKIDSLGMDAVMTTAPGWSNTGGPWVEPSDAMKKLVWRDTLVEGGRTIKLVLPKPYKVNGNFQNIPGKGTVIRNKQYYGDIAVMAVRQSDADLRLRKMLLGVKSSSGNLTLKQLTDGDLVRTDSLRPGGKDSTLWVEYDFSRPVSIRSLSIADGQLFDQYRWKRPSEQKWLETSDDGIIFHKVFDIPNGSCALNTISFPEVKARCFRVVYKKGKKPIPLTELILYAETKVNHAEEKAGFGTPTDLRNYPTLDVKGVDPEADIVDLTQFTNDKGRLTWLAPKGLWRIYRFGFSLTGKANHPAPAEATGLEADKLDSAAMHRYLDQYFARMDSFMQGRIGKAMTSLLMDSYEAGIANWTPRMRQEFRARRGYDLWKWLPALAGVVMKDGTTTDKFLFDYRRTISDLTEQNLFQTVAEEARKRGLTSYIEGHETCRVLETDGMSIKGKATYPMGAMWAIEQIMGYRGVDYGKEADTHETASVAHIFGQNIAAAESMTSNGKDGKGLAYSLWSGCLKPVADLEFANGINRIVIHCSDHQPDDTHIPGMSLGIYGQWFHRHETWAEYAKPWIDYLARSSYMLQQGQYVADVAYYYGDDANATSLFSGSTPAVPYNYSFDYLSTPVLMKAMKCEHGQLVAPSGIRYRLLALDANTRRMDLQTLQRIGQWIKDGLNVCGAKPTTTESMTDDDQAFRTLADELWSGKYSNVHTGTIGDALKAIGVQPDFDCDVLDSVRFVHRTINPSISEDATSGKTEIYWVDNRSFTPRTIQARFRVTGLKPERWDPETGAVSSLGYEQQNGSTLVPLHMQGGEACFVVFRDKTETASVPAPKEPEYEVLKTIDSPWIVTFQKDRGAPDSVVVDTLKSYTEFADKGIKYFSGTAVYTNSFNLSKKELSKRRIMLDLGRVGVLAQVYVNGIKLPLSWHAPYAVDITDAVKKGDNQLRIEVVNMWRNRIIGDRQPDAKKKYTFVSYPFYKADSPLQPSGLMGPCRLYQTIK